MPISSSPSWLRVVRCVPCQGRGGKATFQRFAAKGSSTNENEGRARTSRLSIPLEAPAAPYVGVGDEHGGDEQDHLDQPVELQGVEVDRPRVEEDDLDVEDDEEHRDDEVLHREPAAADGLRRGLDA